MVQHARTASEQHMPNTSNTLQHEVHTDAATQARVHMAEPDVG